MENKIKFHYASDVGAVGEYNTTIKEYKGNRFKLRYNSYSNLKGLCLNNKHNGNSTEEQLERYRQKRLFQRREMIQDLAYNFDKWEYFITLTFNDDKVDGYDYEEVFKKLSQWLKNQKKKNPDMIYLIVPELHPTSGRIHFHGLFARVSNWNLAPAINPKTGNYIYKNSCQIYNLINYKLGFTTVSRIKNINAVSFYISKYMTKELLNLKNKKNIWHSKNLTLPPKKYLLINDINDLNEVTKDYNVTYDNFTEKGSTLSYYANFEL